MEAQTSIAKVKKTDRISPVRVKLEIEIPQQAVSSLEARTVNQLKNTAKIPGFRPGKVPTDLIRKRFQDEIQRDVVSHLLESGLHEAFQQTKLMPVSRPTIQLKGGFDVAKPLEFEAEFEVRPEIELKEYKGISVETTPVEATDEEVNEQMDYIRQRFAVLEPVEAEKSEKGHHAVAKVGFAISEDPPIVEAPKEMTLEVGVGKLLPEIDEALTGMKVGDSTQVHAKFPENYGEQKLAGKKADFSIELLELKKLILPELNDAFANQVKDGTTLLELRSEIRKQISSSKQKEQEQGRRQKLLEKLVEKNAFEVPPSMVAERMDAMRKWMGEEQRRRGMKEELELNEEEVEKLRGRAEFQVRGSLLLSTIAIKESISINENEVERRVEEIAKQTGHSVDESRKWLKGKGMWERLREEVLTDQVFDFLLNNASLGEAKL